MATISILANTVRPSVDCRLDDTAFGTGTCSWQDPVHSWKAGPGLNGIMTVENVLILFMGYECFRFYQFKVVRNNMFEVD